MNSRPLHRSVLVRLLVMAALGGCTPERASDPTARALPEGRGGSKPYLETIPGTMVQFRMIPLPGHSPSLCMAATEVTWDQYDLFMYRTDLDAAGAAADDAVTRPSKPYLPPDRGYGHAGYPAISMSYHGAEQFCHWLSRMTGKRYRLPTEEEWSDACAKGSGNELVHPSGTREWHASNSGGTTHPVGTTAADGLGMHDMAGNVAEWCTGADGKPIVLGGSFRDSVEEVGCGARRLPSSSWNASDPQIPRSQWWLADGPFVGFRVVCEGPIAQREQKEEHASQP
jgi:formylglycine-generating enzyme required for sulfatase activity